MAEIDDVLRDAFSRVATDAPTTGVADAIRARVAAGDTGTPASSSGFPTGIRAWLPFVGLIVIAAIVGGALGLSGVFGHPVITSVTAGHSVSAPSTTATSESSPTPSPSTSGAPGAPAAPVAPVAPVAPTAPKAKDTTAPVLVVGAPSAGTIWGTGSTCTPTATTISTNASDAGGVAATSASSSQPATTIAPSGPPTATTFTVSVNDPGIAPPVTVTITVTSTDASGNTVAHSTTFTLYPSGNCVF